MCVERVSLCVCEGEAGAAATTMIATHTGYTHSTTRRLHAHYMQATHRWPTHRSLLAAKHTRLQKHGTRYTGVHGSSG